MISDVGTFSGETEERNRFGFSVQNLGLLDRDASPAFESITRLAMRLFGVSAAAISIVQENEDRQFFLSQLGLPEPWGRLREAPLSHSFCKHVKSSGKPLVISDARRDSRINSIEAVEELGVCAYLGVPIYLPCGNVIGALCVTERSSRVWTDEEKLTLSDLAHCVNDEIFLRATIFRNEFLYQKSQRYNGLRDSISSAFMVPDIAIEERFHRLLSASCRALGVNAGRIVKLDGGQVSTIFEWDPDCQLEIQNVIPQLDSLAKFTTAECEQVFSNDLVNNPLGSINQTGDGLVGCYAASPLIFDGILYGVIDYFDPTPRANPWSEEDLSIVGVVSMFATAHLGIFGQISMLRSSESALLEYIAELRNPSITTPPVKCEQPGRKKGRHVGQEL